MSKTYETGHAKNVVNFQKLIEFVTDYGSVYNPAKTSLKLTTLIALQTEAKGSLEEVIAKNTLYNNAVNNRISEFSDLRTLSTPKRTYREAYNNKTSRSPGRFCYS